MKKTITFLLCLFFLHAQAANPLYSYVRISTSKGTCIIRLYNETPLHRDNFIKLTNEGMYNGTLFHRVIKEFMIQGGDPDSKNATPESSLGSGDVGYRIPAEFKENLFHKKGALAAARVNNPEKASSGSQFYIVQGKIWTDSTLNQLEKTRLKTEIPQWKREVYKTIGGTPHLDQNYTVFGEVVEGIDMVDQIAGVTTKKEDRPEEDIAMTVTVLMTKEAKKLERKIAKEEKRNKKLLLKQQKIKV